MAEFSETDKKIVIKIVYYGPALSGKTTNLMQLHDMINPVKRGELMSFETKGDRTLFFDLLPMMVKSESGFRIKAKLFTVPGQVAHDATRKALGEDLTTISALSGLNYLCNLFPGRCPGLVCHGPSGPKRMLLRHQFEMFRAF